MVLMALIQLDFFEKDEMSELKAEIAELRDKMDRQRKSQFAKIGAQEKQIAELKETVELLVRNICHGKQ